MLNSKKVQAPNPFSKTFQGLEKNGKKFQELSTKSSNSVKQV